ncbi:hypothetical protein Tco_0466257 [Tanacetum coccineum]
MVQMMISLTHIDAINSLCYVQEFKEFKYDEHASNDVWTKQFKPRSLSNVVCSHQFRPRSSTMDVVWTKQFKPRSSSKDVWTKQFRPPNEAEERTVLQEKFNATMQGMVLDQTGSNSGKLHVSLAGPNPEHMDD